MFGCFGGLTPEKRVPQILAAFAATLASRRRRGCCSPASRAGHYDLRGEIRRLGLGSMTVVTGYLESDERA